MKKSNSQALGQSVKTAPKNSRLRALAAALAFAGLFGAQAASATPLVLTNGDTITLTYNGAAQGDPYGGGEFYASGATIQNGSSGSFFTFCLEYSEHFSLNNPYIVQINTGAVNGGLSTAHTYTGDVDGTANFDPVSHATAWLYTQFRNDSLANFTQGNQTHETALQLAIWYLEGELSGAALTDYNANSVAQGYVTAAINAGWTTNGNVRALNLTDSGGGLHQDQLYMVVPEPASLALLGLGLFGLGFGRRRKA